MPFYSEISTKPGSGALVNYRGVNARRGHREDLSALAPDFILGLLEQAAVSSNLVVVNTALANLTGTTKKAGPILEIDLVLGGVAMAMTDTASNGSHGGIKLIDLADGAFTVLGGTADLSVARTGAISGSAVFVCAMGTTATANDNDTLTTTEADILPSTSVTLTAGANANVHLTRIAAPAVFDGTSTAVDLYLNAAIPEATGAANGTLTWTGTIKLVLAFNGNH